MYKSKFAQLEFGLAWLMTGIENSKVDKATEKIR